MVDRPDYQTGTISLTNGSTSVTGAGTSFHVAPIRSGDMLWCVVGAEEYDVAIGADATTATALTLAKPWPGPTLEDVEYRIWLKADGERNTAATVRVLEILAAGIGNMVGPDAATDSALVLFDGTTGKATKDSSVVPSAVGLATISAANAGDAQTALGISTFIKTLLDDVDADAARATLGANDAANLTTGTLDNARVSNSLTADKAFRRGNVLGTVSQASGVPTGAIIERGGNANGSYRRFADGLQICNQITQISTAVSFQVGSLASDPGGQTWTFPVAFGTGEIPAVAGYVLLAGSFLFIAARGSGANATTFTYHVVSGATIAASTITVGLIAVGRWF